MSSKLSELGRAALDYQARKWSIIPLRPGDKTPLVEWTKWQAARPTARQVEAWFRTWPSANVGVITGEISNLTVLDVDIKPGKNKHGDATLARLVAEHGELPPTVQQRTWSGGLHYFFQYVPGINNSASKLGPSLDLRSDGGFVVAPGSVIQADGQTSTYEWLHSPAEQAIAQMPEWLARLCKERQRETQHNKLTEAPGFVSSLLVFPPNGAAASLRTLLDTAKPGLRRMVLCPVHADTQPSLRVFILPDGRPWIKCFGRECPRHEILRALGEEYESL
jgi:hypothetical protein